VPYGRRERLTFVLESKRFPQAHARHADNRTITFVRLGGRIVSVSWNGRGTVGRNPPLCLAGK